MFIHTLFYVFTYIHNNGDHWKSPPANAINSLSPEPLEDGGFYSESPSYVFSLLDIKRARSPISLKGTSAIKMCFIIKPETILSLFSPKWKEQVFFKKIHIQLEMATLNEAIQRWKERRSRQVYVLLSVVRHFQSIRGTSQIACHLFESRHFAHSHFCCLTNPRDSKKKLQYIQKANKFNPNMMKNAM